MLSYVFFDAQPPWSSHILRSRFLLCRLTPEKVWSMDNSMYSPLPRPFPCSFPHWKCFPLFPSLRELTSASTTLAGLRLFSPFPLWPRSYISTITGSWKLDQFSKSLLSCLCTNTILDPMVNRKINKDSHPTLELSHWRANKGLNGQMYGWGDECIGEGGERERKQEGECVYTKASLMDRPEVEYQLRR